MKRKICVVVHSRANYGRIKSLMKEIKASDSLELQVITGASALLYRYGEVFKVIENDGFNINAFVYSIVEGDTPSSMVKSTGLTAIELANHFQILKPDVVVTVADRYETMATAIAASYMNIPLAHTQGGEVSGSIDESVRHAITRLAHIHFPASQLAYDNLIRMGEEPHRIFFTGCPAIDILATTDLSWDPKLFDRYGGVGQGIDPNREFVVVLQHPVTTEYGDAYSQIAETLQAIEKIESRGMQVVWLWPNVDAGSDQISKGLRQFRETKNPQNIHFFRNFTPEDYAKLLNNCKVLIGNSSSGIRECSYLGIPVVNIGNRQSGRERGDNVVDVAHDAAAIESAIVEQASIGRRATSKIYGDGKAGEKMLRVLETKTFDVRKILTY